MLKINKKTITLTRGDNASIRLRPRYDDEERTEYVVEEGDRVIFRMKVKKQLIEKECSISVENNRIVVSFIPQDTIDLSPGVYRYEAELITSWQMHYTFLQDQTFILTKELERRLGTEIGGSNSGNENSTSEIDGELSDDNIIDGDLQPTNPSLDYDTLENKPVLNGKRIQGSHDSEYYGIPTKTSDLENDSDFVSDAEYVHTDNNYDDDSKDKVDSLGTVYTYNVPESGDAADNEVVKGNDGRLTNARTPVAHTHKKSEITDFSHSHTKNDITDFGHSHTKSDITDFTHTHTKSEITDFGHSHTKSEITNFAHTHTKSEITDFPTKLSAFNNDQGFIDNTVNNLANYYLKSDTYTKTEVTNLINAIQQGRFEVVSSLPATGTPNVIYLLPKSTAQTSNVYDEYVYINNVWEKIGDTEIDLSGYVTTEALNTALNDYLTTSAFSSAIAAYYTRTETDTLLSNKVDKEPGKGLSTNDYSATDKNKLANVTAGATKVESSNTNGNIKINGSETTVYNDTSIQNAVAGKQDKEQGKGLSANDYTTNEKNKLSNISDNANNVRSSSRNGYIKIDNTETRVYNDEAIQTALAGKAEKSEMAITDGTGADADKTTIQLKDGLSKAVLKEHQDISGKQDKLPFQFVINSQDNGIDIVYETN